VDIPGLEVSQASIRVQDFPAGRGVRMRGEYLQQEAELIFFPQPSRLWLVAFETAGSARAKRNFERIMNTLALPGTPSPTPVPAGQPAPPPP
jgi:hypothetical protein